MKRKYDCPKVKIGDWVYISEYDYYSVCRYKVFAICNEEKIIVEVKDNGEDSSIILGWPTDAKYSIKKEYNLPSGIKAWFVSLWKKAGEKCLNIE
jgi:hypothetical protein